ncbi:VOC family protein [Saccharicrinis aurantiacus]|uniref:VOC family protein n=1 Tax=Saccharicrinis aurantiacus TaxID=1849719 RepID=UPI0024914B1A|nr:VOC family protein [Saccharicrinis aurantiacus]
MKSKIETKRKGNTCKFNFSYRFLCLLVFVVVSTVFISAQNSEQAVANDTSKEQARVIGLKNICVHVLELEKTLKLYREILGFKLDDADVFKGKGIEGMLAMKLKANDLTITLSLTAPEYLHTIGPVGNTNHNHFMLQVNDIGPIGDKLKEEGYTLENENYVRDKYTFFVGPNGEIIGLSAW